MSVRWPLAALALVAPLGLAQAGPPSPAPAVRYPLGPFAPPDLGAEARLFTLTDLRWRATDVGDTSQSMFARVRLRAWGFLSAEVEGDSRTVALQTQRTTVAFGGAGGAYRAFAGYRAPRLLLEADVQRRAPVERRGLIVSLLGAGRLSGDVELLARFVGDSRPLPARVPFSLADDVRDRFARAGSLGLLWQRGTHFEGFVEAARARVRTSGGLEFERDTLAAHAVALLAGAEVEGGVQLDDSHGRFPRRELAPHADVRLRRGRWLLEGAARGRLERGSRWLAREYAGALTWHARRVQLAREGPAAERLLALVRRANALGYNERREAEDEGRRAVRERLALSPERARLRDDLAALHVAEVDQRRVPLLGLEWHDADERVDGVRSRTWRALVGVPWPPAWPWRAGEGAAPFLTLEGERRRDVYGFGLPVVSHELAVTGYLSRDLELRMRWRRPDPTPLDIVRAQGRPRVLEWQVLYALGR